MPYTPASSTDLYSGVMPYTPASSTDLYSGVAVIEEPGEESQHFCCRELVGMGQHWNNLKITTNRRYNTLKGLFHRSKGGHNPLPLPPQKVSHLQCTYKATYDPHTFSMMTELKHTRSTDGQELVFQLQFQRFLSQSDNICLW